MKKLWIQSIISNFVSFIEIATHLLILDGQYPRNFWLDTNLFRSPKSQNDHIAVGTNEFRREFHSLFWTTRFTTQIISSIYLNITKNAARLAQLRLFLSVHSLFVIKYTICHCSDACCQNCQNCNKCLMYAFRRLTFLMPTIEGVPFNSIISYVLCTLFKGCKCQKWPNILNRIVANINKTQNIFQ